MNTKHKLWRPDAIRLSSPGVRYALPDGFSLRAKSSWLYYAEEGYGIYEIDDNLVLRKENTFLHPEEREEEDYTFSTWEELEEFLDEKYDELYTSCFIPPANKSIVPDRRTIAQKSLIEFTPLGNSWYESTYNGFLIRVKAYANGSIYGIRFGRISKLSISKDKKTYISYDRNTWDVFEEDREANFVYTQTFFYFGDRAISRGARVVCDKSNPALQPAQSDDTQDSECGEQLPALQGIVKDVDEDITILWDDGTTSRTTTGVHIAAEDELKTSLDWVGAHQKAGFCPRCGKIMKELSRHALSRRAKVTICDECGIHEALETFSGTECNLEDWWCAGYGDDWRWREVVELR